MVISKEYIGVLGSLTWKVIPVRVLDRRVYQLQTIEMASVKVL